MGDLRNKLAKQIRDERHRQFMARHYPPKPPPKPLTCLCGFTSEDTKLWGVSDPRLYGKAGVYCAACLPAELASEAGIEQPPPAPNGQGCISFTSTVGLSKMTEPPTTD